MQKDKFTFIVNTYPSQNREVELVKCLNSIFNQTYKNFNVLLVENYISDLELKPILKEFTKYKQQISVLVDATKRLSYLFDIGWKNTNTEYIAYVADDVELESDWLENVYRELISDENIGVATGPIISSCFPAGEMHRLYLISQKNLLLKVISWPYLHFAMENKILKPGNLSESGAYSLGASIEEAKNYERQEIDLATTSSMGIRKSLLVEINGFDQRFNFNHADGDLFIRIKKAGYKIIFNPKIISHHNLRMGPSRNARIIGLDTGIFYKKHIRPKSIKGWVGAFLNICFLNTYWVYNAIRTKDPKQLLGITGFVKGILSSSAVAKL